MEATKSFSKIISVHKLPNYLFPEFFFNYLNEKGRNNNKRIYIYIYTYTWGFNGGVLMVNFWRTK